MASLLGVDYPFLDAAYRPAPPPDDSGIRSFMEARRQRLAERQHALEEQQQAMQQAESAIRRKVEEQTFQLNAIKITDAIRSRDDQVQAQGAFSVFADRIRRAQQLGASEPVAQKGVTDWLAENRGLLSLPAGKALWDDYLKSVDEDRRNKATIEAIRARGETQLGVAGLRADQAIALEESKQENRVELARLEAELKNQLKVGKTEVTRAQFINRQLRGYAGQSPFGGETEAEKKARFDVAAETLGSLYDRVLREQQSTPPTTIPKPAPSPTPAPASPYSTKEDVVNAFKAGKIDRAEAARILTEQFGVPLK